MKLVFEANQIAEAHIIKHLLEQAGLHPALNGEYLQGAVGELAAYGTLKLMVPESELEEAQVVIKTWDEAEWDEDAWKNETI